MQKPTLNVLELKSILYPRVKTILMRYPEIQTIWLWMASSAFTDEYLTVMLNHKDVLMGLSLSLRGINRTPWGTKLFLMAVLIYSVYCLCLCHILNS